MSNKKIISLLKEIEQTQFLEIFLTLTPREQESIARQLCCFDYELLERMKKTLDEGSPSFENVTPYKTTAKQGNAELKEIGKQLLEGGKCGILVAAGGLGSRLRYPGPKGVFPISPIKQKSLYQRLAERCVAASSQVGYPLQMAFLTSAANHAETGAYFAENAFFGLVPRQVSFIVQPTWPVLDINGNFFLESRTKIACGPNGNGSALSSLVEEGVFGRWRQLGIEYIIFVQIDNPLADPFDPEFIGFAATQGGEVTIKAIERIDPNESVGILVKKADGKLGVCEYNEIDSSLRQEVDENGNLLFPLANISHFCFTTPFVERSPKFELPLHPAKKSLLQLMPDATSSLPETPNSWKFEHFIFDVLPFAGRGEAIVYPREGNFAPLKNYQGEDSIATVQRQILESDRKVYEKVSGLSIESSRDPFELSMDFHYPTGELLEKWKGRPLPHADYIFASMENER